MGTHKQHKVIPDPVYGYRRLDPLPEEDELSAFYESRYYHLVRQGGRAPELRRLMAGGEEAEQERTWLEATLCTDICQVLDEYGTGTRVLDIGCGTGEFVAFLHEHGFDPVGIEPSPDAVAMATAQGRPVECTTLQPFVERHRAFQARAFDAVTMLNVIEHVRHPAEIIELAKTLLAPGGLLCVRAPNDFTELQLAAQTQLQKPPWWIAAPDHINYFDVQSLRSFLEHFGFDIVYAQTDFPMELFLLMGEDYTGRPELGTLCHQKRVRFELAVSGKLRRRIYQALAQVGIGRASLVFGRLVAS